MLEIYIYVRNMCILEINSCIFRNICMSKIYALYTYIHLFSKIYVCQKKFVCFSEIYALFSEIYDNQI